MKYEILIPGGLDQVNPLDDNVDVLVQTERGERYSFVVATPDNLKALMKNEGLSYLRPGAPMLFAESITEENIRALVNDLLDQGEALCRVYGTNMQ